MKRSEKSLRKIVYTIVNGNDFIDWSNSMVDFEKIKKVYSKRTAYNIKDALCGIGYWIEVEHMKFRQVGLTNVGKRSMIATQQIAGIAFGIGDFLLKHEVLTFSAPPPKRAVDTLNVLIGAGIVTRTTKKTHVYEFSCFMKMEVKRREESVDFFIPNPFEPWLIEIK
jgi:hypothetical protein